MRKLFAAVLCAALLVLGGCDVSEMSTLPELSRPYAAVYQCEELTLGGEDFSERLESRIELGHDGTFVLFWRTKTGAEGEQTGRYSVDTEREEITFSARRGGRELSHTFPLEQGAILIDLNLGGRLLHAAFRMP